MAPPHCPRATRFDVLEEVRLMVSLERTRRPRPPPIGLGRTSSSGSKKRTCSRESEAIYPRYVISSMATSRRVSEFPGVFGISESDCGQRVRVDEGEHPGTYYIYISTSTSRPDRILQSFYYPYKPWKHPPPIMFKQALRPLVRGYATAAAQLNKEVNGFVGAVG
jgi:hypothetical protein